MGLFNRALGIDLGTVNTLVSAGGNIVVNEPSVVAIERSTGQVLAVGAAAAAMLGRAPADIDVIRPLRAGVVADYGWTAKLLSHFIQQAVGRHRLFKPRVVIGVAYQATSVERRAITEAVLAAGAREVYLVEEPVAAAIGAGLTIHDSVGGMVVDIGGGTTGVAVLALGGIITGRSIPVGGIAMDEAILDYCRRECRLIVGERTAEEIKMNLGWALCPGGPAQAEGNAREGGRAPEGQPDELVQRVSGRDLLTGLPKAVELSRAQVARALAPVVAQIVQAVQAVLETTPAEVAADLAHTGICLTGGGSMLGNLPAALQASVGLECRLAADPLTCVVRGTSQILQEIRASRSLTVLNSVQRAS